MRHIDLTLRTEGVVLALQIQLFNLQLGRFQIQFCVQCVDRGCEKCERCALQYEMSADFAVARIHRSVDCDRSREISGIGAKKTGEIAEITDRCGNVAAKVRAEPVGRVAWERGFAAQSELVCPLFDI